MIIRDLISTPGQQRFTDRAVVEMRRMIVHSVSRRLQSRMLVHSSVSRRLQSSLAFMSSSRYTLAITRHVPKSFPNAITKFASSTSHIDLLTTQQQHDIYLEKLRKFVPTVCLPPLNDLPDSLFVEDTVVSIGNKAVITHPGHPSRRAEVKTVRDFLKNQLGMEVTDMAEQNNKNGGNIFCDGGDVLNTSRHLFVGLSARTTKESLHVLEEVLNVEAIPVAFQGNALHLKSIVTHVDEETLLVPTGLLGDDVLRTMEAIERGYTVIRVPNMLACNVIAVNGGLIAQHLGDKKVQNILEQIALERNMAIEFVDCSEIAKADAALTCCSVLLSI